jgi:hypothetical protein
MVRTYLDSNAHGVMADGIAPVAPPAADVEAFRVAVQAGLLVAPVSLANLDELLGVVVTDPSRATVRLASVQRLVGFHGMLKQPADLLREAIEAYAAGVAAPPVILPEAERLSVVRILTEVRAGSRRHDDTLQQIATDVRQMKAKWEKDIEAARQLAHVALKKVAPKRSDRQALSFADYFATAGPDVAAAFASPLGCAGACRQRGLNGLLNCRTVRLCVGVALSQIYSQTIGQPGGEPREPERSDGYDIWHAVLASTADILVTFDKRFADHVARIPGLGGFRVARSLAELLTDVHRA